MMPWWFWGVMLPFLVFGIAAVFGLIAGLFLRWAAVEDERLEREAQALVAEEVRELERIMRLPAREPGVWR